MKTTLNFLIISLLLFINLYSAEVKKNKEAEAFKKHGSLYIGAFVNRYAISEGHARSYYGHLKEGIDCLLNAAQLYLTNNDRIEAKKTLDMADLYIDDLDPEDLQKASKKLDELKAKLK